MNIENITIALFFGFLCWVLWKIIGYFNNANDNVKAGLIGIFGMLIVTLFTQYYTHSRDVEERHFSEKSAAYTKIMTMFFDILKMSKEGKEMEEDELLARALEIKRDLIIWGSEDVIVAWNEFEKSSVDNLDPVIILSKVDNIFRIIRSDLGHSDTKLQQGDLFKLILIAKDKDIF